MSPSPHIPEHDGPAARLLATADRLFYEQGYAATGVNQLVADAGVAKASFYQHYPAKQDLAVAYLDQRAHAWFSALVASVERCRTPRTRISAAFAHLDDWLKTNGYRGCAFQNAAAEFPDPQSPPRLAIAAAKSAIRAYLTELCTDAGHPNAGDEVFLLFEGATAQAAVTGQSWPVEAARRAAEQRISGT